MFAAQAEEPVTPTKSEKSPDREPSPPVTPVTPITPVTPVTPSTPTTPTTPATPATPPSPSTPPPPTTPVATPPVVNGNSSPVKQSSPKLAPANNTATTTNNGNKNVEELYDIPVGKWNALLTLLLITNVRITRVYRKYQKNIYVIMLCY